MKSIYITLLLLININTSTSSQSNPFKVLGVSRTASKSEIQKAYRRLAKQYHPDVSKDPKSEEKFKEVVAAYEALIKDQSDPPNEQYQFHKTFFQRFTGRQEQYNELVILTVKRFEQEVIPDSYINIHLVKVTSRRCFLCFEYNRLWPEINKHFESYRMKFWELPFDKSNMKEKLSVYEIPSLLVIISGRVYHFTHLLSLENIESFILSKIESVLTVEKVNDRTIDTFVGDFSDNKARLIFVSKTFTFTQGMAAFKYKDSFKYGFSSTNDENSKNIWRILPSSSLGGVIIFKEVYPAISRKETVRTTSQLFNIMESEKRLLLPKICSPKTFDDLCSVSNDNPCVIFVLDSKDQYILIKNLIQSGELQFKRNFQFSFIFRDAQFQFVDAFFPPYPSSNVLLLKRTSSTHAIVEWLPKWDLVHISTLYKTLHSAKDQLTRSPVKIGVIIDELDPTILDNIWEFILYSSENLIGQIHLISLNTWLSIISIITLFCVTFLINNDGEEQRQGASSQEPSAHESMASYPVNLPELTPECAPYLLSCTKPQVTLLIVGDLSNQSSLPPLPVRVVSARLRELAKNSIYTLAFVSHTKYEAWLYDIATQADCRLIQGSVIALNLNKKYFHFFTPINTCSNSSLVNLQDRVTLWFERLCEGSLPKFRTNSLQFPFTN